MGRFFFSIIQTVTYINATSIEVGGKAYTINATTKLVDAAGKTVAIGDSAINGKVALGDHVTVDNNVITLWATKAQVDAAIAVNTQIKDSALKVDTLTYGDKAAVTALENAYKALTNEQKAYVETANVAKLNALVAKMAELAVEPELIAGIAASNDTLALSKVLANPLFKNVIEENMGAYLTAKGTLVTDIATVNAAIIVVNNAQAEAKAIAAIAASNDTLALSKALANPLFKNVIEENMAAYLAAKGTLITDAATVNAAINAVNVKAVADGIALTFAANGVAGTAVMPSVPTGYTIAVKTSSDATKYDTAGKIVAAGTSNVVYTVTHTASGKTADTGTVAVTVTVVTP